MKNLGLSPIIVAAMIASTTLAPAQNSSTEPKDKGKTGWTGGARDQPTQEHTGGSSRDGAETTGQAPADPAKAAEAARETETAKTQPLMATGLDLKGPPVRFPANKTPE